MNQDDHYTAEKSPASPEDFNDGTSSLHSVDWPDRALCPAGCYHDQDGVSQCSAHGGCVEVSATDSNHMWAVPPKRLPTHLDVMPGDMIQPNQLNSDNLELLYGLSDVIPFRYTEIQIDSVFYPEPRMHIVIHDGAVTLMSMFDALLATGCVADELTTISQCEQQQYVEVTGSTRLNHGTRTFTAKYNNESYNMTVTGHHSPKGYRAYCRHCRVYVSAWRETKLSQFILHQSPTTYFYDLDTARV